MEITLDDDALKALSRQVGDALEAAADDPDSGWQVAVCEALAEHLGPAVQAEVARRGEGGLRERLFEVVQAWEDTTLPALLRAVALELRDAGVEVDWSRATADALDQAPFGSDDDVVDDDDLGDDEA